MMKSACLTFTFTVCLAACSQESKPVEKPVAPRVEEKEATKTVAAVSDSKLADAGASAADAGLNSIVDAGLPDAGAMDAGSSSAVMAPKAKAKPKK